MKEKDFDDKMDRLMTALSRNESKILKSIETPPLITRWAIVRNDESVFRRYLIYRNRIT